MQIIESGYYNLLRINNMEMLCVYIETITSKTINKIRSKSNLTFNEVVDILNSMGR